MDSRVVNHTSYAQTDSEPLNTEPLTSAPLTTEFRPEILTKSGNTFSFTQPELSQFDITDIAHGLSNICRFGGQSCVFYSVAQHSVLTSYIVPDSEQFAALLHDASEAFIGDIPKPLKELLPDYKLIEKRVETEIFKRFNIPFPLPKSIKRADLIMLATEQRDLMPKQDEAWLNALNIRPLTEKITPLPPHDAYSLFMNRYKELRQN